MNKLKFKNKLERLVLNLSDNLDVNLVLDSPLFLIDGIKEAQSLVELDINLSYCRYKKNFKLFKKLGKGVKSLKNLKILSLNFSIISLY